MKKKTVSSVILILLLVLSAASLTISKGWAWSNSGYSADPSNPDYGTHDWIAEHALDWLPQAEKQYIQDNPATYLHGTELPDNGQAPDGIGDSARHHIYFRSDGSLQDDAAATRATEEYAQAQTLLEAGNYSEAAKKAGIISHYIVDMAVFGHAMGASTEWGAETHHSDYEDYVNAQSSSYASGFNSYLSFDGILETVSAYDAARNLAYDTTFDVDGDLTCVWMDQNYDWSNQTFKNRAGESLNLAVNYLADVLHTLYQAYAAEAYISVPYHSQINSYYCGPAALEMLFDFYGPDTSQSEIADAARTAPDGTYTPDMVRAAHFSNLSTSVGNEMLGSIAGYSARRLGYAAFEYHGMTIEQLKSLIMAGYPIIVLTTWHFRVAVGYSSTYITFQDSYYGPLYNMTYQAFDDDWNYSSHWALFVSPWEIEISVPNDVVVERVFNVTARVTYPILPPFFAGQFPASSSNATVMLSEGLSLVQGETAKKTIGTGDLVSGASTNVTWAVRAENLGSFVIGVEAEGKVAGYAPPLPSYPTGYSYEDRIGGFSQTALTVLPEPDETPPTTLNDYDGLWHTEDFKITLAATDDISGVAETYYKINQGPLRILTTDGQPLIATEASNNALEYWSVDNAGNEEFAHHVLTGIKLDKTAPSGSIVINNDAPYTTSRSALLALTATDATSGVIQMRFSYDNSTWTSWEPFSTSKPWMISTAGDGTRTLYVEFVDRAGLISQSYSDATMLDETVPNVLITSPSPGSEVKSSRVAVTWTGSDETSDIDRYEIRLDGSSWLNVAGNTTHTFTGLADGRHVIDIKAVDNAGNIEQETLNFLVNTSPLFGPGYGEEAVLAAVTVVLALRIGVYLLKRRSR